MQENIQIQEWINVTFKKGSSSKYSADCLGIIIGLLKTGLLIQLKQEVIEKIENKFRELSNKQSLTKELLLQNIEDVCFEVQEIKAGDVLFTSNKFMPIHFGIFISNDLILETNDIKKKSFLSSFNNLDKKKNTYKIFRFKND